MNTEQFLHRLLVDQDLRADITSLNFDVIQNVALKHGYTISASEVDTMLAQSPELAEQLQTLIVEAELEFELDEAEIALIAGGTTVNCQNGQRREFGDSNMKMVL